MGKLVEYFAGQKYGTVQDVLQHASAISQRIAATKPKLSPRQLAQHERMKGRYTPRTFRIIKAAPSFLHGDHYNYRGLAKEVARIEGRELTELQLRRFGRYIANRLFKLRQLGLAKQSKPLVKPILRAARSQDVRKYNWLVERTLARGHGFMRGKWYDWISRDQAKSAALQGLQKGLETASDNSSNLEAYLTMKIASQVGNEVRSARRKAKREKLSTGKFETESSTPAPEEELLLESDLALLMSHPKARPHHVAVYTLRGFGHSYLKIASEVGVNFMSVYAAHQRALSYLKELKQSQK